MRYTTTQSVALVLLRITIGWHFLYEGGVKVLSPHWTSKAYLLDSGGFLKGFFEQIAGSPTLLGVADFANAWGLTLIGLSLIIGICTRYSSVAGIVLLGDTVVPKVMPAGMFLQICVAFMCIHETHVLIN